MAIGDGDYDYVNLVSAGTVQLPHETAPTDQTCRSIHDKFLSMQLRTTSRIEGPDHGDLGDKRSILLEEAKAEACSPVFQLSFQSLIWDLGSRHQLKSSQSWAAVCAMLSNVPLEGSGDLRWRTTKTTTTSSSKDEHYNWVALRDRDDVVMKILEVAGRVGFKDSAMLVVSIDQKLIVPRKEEYEILDKLATFVNHQNYGSANGNDVFERLKNGDFALIFWETACEIIKRCASSLNDVVNGSLCNRVMKAYYEGQAIRGVEFAFSSDDDENGSEGEDAMMINSFVPAAAESIEELMTARMMVMGRCGLHGGDEGWVMSDSAAMFSCVSRFLYTTMAQHKSHVPFVSLQAA